MYFEFEWIILEDKFKIGYGNEIFLSNQLWYQVMMK